MYFDYVTMLVNMCLENSKKMYQWSDELFNGGKSCMILLNIAYLIPVLRRSIRCQED